MDDGSAALAMKSTPANRFESFDNVMLADEMGAIETSIKSLERRRDEARAEMTRRKVSAIESARFLITKTVGSSWRFNTKAARQKMGEAWYTALKTQLVNSTTFTVREKLQQLGVSDGSKGASPDCADASPAHAAAEALFRKPA